MLINFYFKLKKKWRNYISRKRMQTELNLIDSYEDLIDSYFQKAKDTTEKYRLFLDESLHKNQILQDKIDEQSKNAIRQIEAERGLMILALLQQADKISAKKLEFFGDSEGEEE